MVHVPGEEAHGEDFEEEIHGGQIDQTEEEEPEGTEVECEQAVQEDNGQRLLTERLAQLCGDVAGMRTVFLMQTCHEALELGRGLLLGFGVAHVVFLEPAIDPGGVCRHLVKNLLLAAGIVEFTSLLSL